MWSHSERRKKYRRLISKTPNSQAPQQIERTEPLGRLHGLPVAVCASTWAPVYAMGYDFETWISEATAAAGAVAGAADAQRPGKAVTSVPAFELDEFTIAQLQEAQRSGKYTSQALVEKYLARIRDIDRAGPTLRAVLETNPDARNCTATGSGAEGERRARSAARDSHSD